MNKNFLYLTFIIGAIAGLAVIGYLRATPGVQNQAYLPKIEIAPQSFDFGEIEFGKVVQYSFKIKNSGNAVLEIKKVATSCACTTAKAAKERLNPGDETELMVTYDTAAMGSGPHGKGRQERIIYVKSNDPASPQVEVMTYAFVR